MPQVIVTEDATSGLERCRTFLQENNPSVMGRAAQVINRQFALLEREAELGRPLREYPALRELIIPFGSSGYVALYCFDPDSDTVYILAFRHQKEVGY